MTKRLPDKAFWSDKKVLITGHTGFKGSWLSIWLANLGAQVSGIALSPNTKPSLFFESGLHESMDSRFTDIRDERSVVNAVADLRPDIVFHLAAQPLVIEGYKDPRGTFDVNTMGLVNVFEAIKLQKSPCIFVVITTDKVYKPSTNQIPHSEDSPLGATDPYGASKVCAEAITECYQSLLGLSNGSTVASVRAGNVIGGGDWAADRLLPDAVRSWRNSTDLIVRSPDSTRPWQHVLEPLAGYLCLVEHLACCPSDRGAYNFGPSLKHELSVGDVVNILVEKLSIGVRVTKPDPYLSETEWLGIESSKAKRIFGFEPIWDAKLAIEKTIAWYENHANGMSARRLCLSDIEFFTNELAYEK